ncbi:uncharacterized protein PHACADRAFT_254453 [Phanerochaete carnosa HHB-10118-sp]|uniref:Uncharacterized protein n=1 Tax=Phanerochaete carnosa (strain HHB-10118-sp) TaxID=650164 RepID=K5X2H0_PHACS|nr:uncharacterized protein PHACADRAFT_254453 [Phanerochaete carnosa HHB-10118-sp]EKM56997.1 hypothetical protein PHACADRAFT_254453 [Phanerochaete carnosa HHB-10118-sp]
MEDVISHERALAFARWTITASDLAEWPHATVDGAGRLEDAHVFTGSSNADMRSLKLKRLTFADSQDPSRGCECFTLSADGKLLAASFRSNDVLVWRLSEGLLVQRLHHQDHEYEVTALSVSPVDYTLVSGSDDGTAIVWDTRRGRVLLRLEGHGGPVSNIIHDHHGALIATGSDDDKSVKIWDASSGVCLHSFGIDDEIYRLTFLPDNSYLYAELKTSHKIYDIRTYTRTITLQHIAGFSPVSRQGDRIVTGAHWDAPGQVKIWSAATGEELLTIDPPKKLSIPVAFSSDGAEVVAACDADTAVVAYDSRTGQLRRIFKLGEPAFCAVYSPDGEYVAFGVRGGKDVELYDAKSGAFLAKFDGQEESGNIRDIQFPPHSHTLLARFGDGRLLLYDIQDVLRMR